jgi:hypothetical protein
MLTRCQILRRIIALLLLMVLWDGRLALRADELLPTGEQRAWWSFQPLAEVTPPDIADEKIRLTDVDRFIHAKLVNQGLAPSSPADKRTLLRRVKFALTGLPPTLQEITAFTIDDSPGAFMRVVNRLLASPHYGEHWGRHWLDVVRYADYLSPQADNVKGPGKENFDFEFYSAYRYRDWVVGALNRDMPFDEFLVHQIAGDQLTSVSGGEFYADGLIATTVLSIGLWDYGDADKKKIVSDIVDDQINLVGKAFLGMTLACARCHNHKFDPISTEDYYGLAGIFYSTRILKNVGPVGLHTNALRVPLATADYLSTRETQLAQIDQLKKKLGINEAAKIGDPDSDSEDANQNASDAALSEHEKTKLKEKLKILEKQLLPDPPTAMAAIDGPTPGGLFPEIGDVPIHYAGRYDDLGPKVPRRLPKFFCGDEQLPIKDGSGRWELAQWIANAENPLTARVIVNRVWHQLFGQGIVRTPNNFGLLGERPTHPDLLDWLARRFIDDGWSLKQLIRMIVDSHTFQQESLSPQTTDPENRWLACYSSRRLRAEEIRDSMLSVTQCLDPKLGGFATQDLHRPRRSLYIQTVRTDRRNFSTLFDAADPEQCIGRRAVSTIAPQSLFFLNDKFVHEQAANLAKRLTSESPDDDRLCIQRAYLVLFGREPDAEEAALGLELIAQARKRNPETVWNEYAHVLLCTNEFCYVE